jgi:hypothetical protein
VGRRERRPRGPAEEEVVSDPAGPLEVLGEDHHQLAPTCAERPERLQVRANVRMAVCERGARIAGVKRELWH